MTQFEECDRVSRRAALIGGGGLAAAFLLQEARAASATPEVPAIVQAWIDAWNSADPVGNLAALYTADAIYDDVPTGLSNVTIGTDVAGFVAAFVQEISGITVQLRTGFGTDSQAAAEWDFGFDYTGQLPGLPAGAGQHIDWHGATIFELADGKIQRSADFYDNTGLLAAVGLLVTPEATPAP